MSGLSFRNEHSALMSNMCYISVG